MACLSRTLQARLIRLVLVSAVCYSFLAFSVALHGVCAAWEAKPHAQGYVAYRTQHSIDIDGRLDEQSWQAADWSDIFQDIQGPSMHTPWFQTRVKLLWDDVNLYIGAYMEEPQPWATLTLHDSVVYHDNDFEIFIDPDGDNWLYYELEVNALGTLWDLLLARPYRDGGPPIMSFETIPPGVATQADGPTGWAPLRHAVWINGTLNDGDAASHGWGVELALPWTLLHQTAAPGQSAPPVSGDRWRVNFSRVQWNVTWDKALRRYVKTPPQQAENNWVWSPQWVVEMHRPEMWGYLQFSDQHVTQVHAGLSAPAAFSLDPAWPARCWLMDLYYAQHAHMTQWGRYSDDLRELGMEAPPPSAGSRPIVEVTQASFLASLDVGSDGTGSTYRHFVNEMGRLSSRAGTTSDSVERS